jgi:hypothetical protein
MRMMKKSPMNSVFWDRSYRLGGAEKTVLKYVPTRHCEEAEGRRGNPESRFLELDCFAFGSQ